MNWQYATNNPNYKPSEYQSLKSKLEKDLKYWQKYKNETRETEHIIHKRNLELSHVKKKLSKLESKVKTLKEELGKTKADLHIMNEQEVILKEIIYSIKQIDILDLITCNNEIDDYSVNDKKTLDNWNNKLKEIL